MDTATGWVSRERLHRLLDSLAQRRVVAVVADAGSGKTVAVRTWLTDRGRRHAHLDLAPVTTTRASC